MDYTIKSHIMQIAYMPPLPKGRGTTLVVEGYVIVLIYVLQSANATKKTAHTSGLKSYSFSLILLK